MHIAWEKYVCVCVSVCSRSALKRKNMWFINLKWKKCVIPCWRRFIHIIRYYYYWKNDEKNKYVLMMTTIPINIKWFFNKYTFHPVMVGSWSPDHCTLCTLYVCALLPFKLLLLHCNHLFFYRVFFSQDWAETKNEQNKIYYQNTHCERNGMNSIQLDSFNLAHGYIQYAYIQMNNSIYSFILSESLNAFLSMFVIRCSLLVARPSTRLL